ncbi:DUF2793 domain-containing protein [Frigidibacter sp. ROC022]|uniref:DUF2793 domain-containing protein n=1 Tax=Frigidibacter sp. ROC022 TaxID=2971796 RepID=UPI00215A1442|nr:DUF2793 domain-containing protein [Frigidibacter sp. ROC022]MCR8726829.1 DUF2793 domain-containing protein [Frigidibacter sp. ROC022]
MSEVSPILSLPYLQPAQAQKHVTHNEALALLDLLVQLVVEGFDAATPPALPAEGEVWALGAVPTGAWAGQAGRIAAFSGGAWRFVTPRIGWRAWGRAESGLRVWDGSLWRGLADLLGFESLDGLGINTAADPVNRLAVAAPAVLLTHDGAGHQLKINKASAADTASLLFQTGYSGRAEMGIAGSDAFAIKVSADGSGWQTALSFAAGSGLASGSAVQSGPADTTAGRLLTLGAFGLGATLVSSDLDDATTPGFHSCTAAAAHAPVAAAGTLIVQRPAAGDDLVTQIFQAGAADGRLHRRHSTDGGASWTGWRLIYDQAGILGPVGQAGGIPTGALIERGSNGNGRYARFADGTQICTHELSLDAPSSASGAVFRGATATSWTFPESFAAGSTPALSASGGPGLDLWFSLAAAGAAGATVRAFRASASSTAPVVSVSAIGRWF